jgi:alpha-1,6-mannosyltransferase
MNKNFKRLTPLMSAPVFYLSGAVFLALNGAYHLSWSGHHSWVAMFSLILIQFILQLLLMRSQKTTTHFWFLISIGILSRLLIFGTEPWLEDDHYRYFWDGHVQNHSLSPYIYPPNSPDLDLIDTSYRHLINYPEVPTVYPTLAQSAFRLLNWASPADTFAFQLLYFILDLMILSLLWFKNKLGRGYLLYWISPFILKEFYNSIHIDFLLLQLFFLSVIWIRSWKSSVFLSLASLVKVFPVIFLGSDLAHKNRKWALRILAPVVCFSIVIWLDTSLLAVGQGLSQFTKYWTFNDSFFNLLTHIISDQKLARITTWIGFLVVTAWLVWKNPYRIQRKIYILSALFFFSPVLNPWYFCWVIPFLCFRPDLRLYSLGLPLYLGYSFFVESEVYQQLKWIQVCWILSVFLWILKKQTSLNSFFLRFGSFKS